MPTSPQKKPIEYPSGDGKPMAEGDFHLLEMVELWEMLKERYVDDPMAYVAINNLFYYAAGKPKCRFSPDVYVVFGIPKGPRDSYKLWEENGRVPSLVFELTSKATRLLDTGRKKELCRKLGVAEYFLFDPLGDYLNPRLQGFRLECGAYVPIKLDAQDCLLSATTSLKFTIEAPYYVRAIEAATGERILRRKEWREVYERREYIRALEAKAAQLLEEINLLKNARR